MTRPAEVLRTLSLGVYVIGVAAGDRHNAFTAAWVMQVSFDPLLVAIGIHPEHRSYALLKEGGGFSINVLGKGQLELARHFGQSADHDKLKGYPWRPGRFGAPLLTDALAWLDCDFHHQCQSGDHVLVIGRVLDGAIQRPGEPLLYRDTGDMDGASQLFPDRF